MNPCNNVKKFTFDQLLEHLRRSHDKDEWQGSIIKFLETLYSGTRMILNENTMKWGITYSESKMKITNTCSMDSWVFLISALVLQGRISSKMILSEPSNIFEAVHAFLVSKDTNYARILYLHEKPNKYVPINLKSDFTSWNADGTTDEQMSCMKSIAFPKMRLCTTACSNSDCKFKKDDVIETNYCFNMTSDGGNILS